jgi:hypothetical protein
MKTWGSFNLTMRLIKYYSNKKCDLPKKHAKKKKKIVKKVGMLPKVN